MRFFYSLLLSLLCTVLTGCVQYTESLQLWYNFLKNKEYIEIIIRRCGGNKEYWRNINERVKDWNIKGITEEIERMIEISLKR